MNWQRPTEFSAETTDGLYYAERNRKGRKWKLWRLRNRRKYFGEFDGLKATIKAAEAAAQCLSSCS